MNAVISFFMDRALTTLCLFFILVVSGASAYMNIPKEAEPDLQLPLVQVGLVLDGVSPVDAERLLVRPAEEQLNDLDGLRNITATASEGRATIILEYGPGADLDKAVQDVRDKIDRARAEMPADIEEPQISEIDLSWFPVVLVAMALTLSVDFFARDVAFGSPATLWWQQLSVTVIFGLIFSTMLTLIVTPAALMWRIRRKEKSKRAVAMPLIARVNQVLTGLLPSRS